MVSIIKFCLVIVYYAHSKKKRDVLLIFALKDQVDEDQMQLVHQASNKHDPIY